MRNLLQVKVGDKVPADVRVVKLNSTTIRVEQFLDRGYWDACQYVSASTAVLKKKSKPATSSALVAKSMCCTCARVKETAVRFSSVGFAGMCWNGFQRFKAVRFGGGSVPLVCSSGSRRRMAAKGRGLWSS